MLPHRPVNPVALRPRPTAPLWALSALVILLGACTTYYAEGQFLERQKRWEEAAIAYHLAVLHDPEEAEYREALKQAEIQVALDNFARYKTYLAEKQFQKAYSRLRDASRQDPSLAPVREEMQKWLRVLVSGQVKFEFSKVGNNIGYADEIRLMIRINTPNPGEVIEAEIDPDDGTFFTEDLLYDRPNELLASYTINSIGVSLLHGRSRIKKFTTTDFRRFINFRTPILDGISGRLPLESNQKLSKVSEHRKNITDLNAVWGESSEIPNPHYSIRVMDKKLVVTSAENTADFTPRFLYINKKDRRLFVDFGRYRLRLSPGDRRWRIARLSLGEEDYFNIFSTNIALEPYFFFRESVIEYQPSHG